MELVDTPVLHPGCCVLTSNSGGPLVDTGHEVAADGRAYIGHGLAIEIGVAAGLVDPQALAAVEEERDDLEREVRELKTKLQSAAILVAEAEELRVAVAYTLERGIVVDKRNGKVKLRPIPGQKSPDLTVPLLAERTPEPEETPA